MGYSLYIERESENISPKEWIVAVNSIEGAKTSDSNITAVNSATNEQISFAGHKEDVSVLFESKKFMGIERQEEWIKCIYFHNGRALFKYDKDMEFQDNPLRVVAAKLANLLNAKIIGDEGEIYDW